jgi:acetylglutamate/LysW-gamma-L-alpha-aminoadipate kinase
MLVIKVGGGADVDYPALCDDIAALTARGVPMVLVHGGSHETNRIATALGSPPRFVTTASGHVSRYTDQAAMDSFLMVYAGKINKRIVELLQQRGINAFGCSGLDGQILRAERKSTVRIVENGKQLILRDDRTGTSDGVNSSLLATLRNAGVLPVIAPIACSHSGDALNVDGDRAAAQIALALQADTLLLLSSVPGLLRTFPDETSLILTIPRAEIDTYMDLAQGRMKKKVMGAAEALAGGVGRVIMADARIANPISTALAGHGTVIA